MCVPSAPMKAAVKSIESEFRSAVFAGIVPDKRHLRNGGFHVCLNHLFANGRADDYSNTRKLDQSTSVTENGRGFSCAFDISLSKADMKRLHANVRRAWLDKTDPRRKFINAINCWDGSGDATRYDFQANTAGYASPDHETHTHGDQPRAYVDVYRDQKEAEKASRAVASVMTGQSKAAWIALEEPKLVLAKAAATKAAKPTAKPMDTAAMKLPVLRRGTTGVQVKVVQACLVAREIWPRTAKSAAVNIDGVFNGATEAKIRVFQGKVGLPVTGVVNDPTWAALAPDRPATVTKGTKGFYAWLMQLLLLARGYNPGTPDGNAGDKTIAALKKFQAARKVPNSVVKGKGDGIGGTATWVSLVTF